MPKFHNICSAFAITAGRMKSASTNATRTASSPSPRFRMFAQQDVDVTDLTASCVRFQQVGMRSESSDQRRTVAAICVSSDEPSPFVDIELHQAFVSHFQQEGLASFLIRDIGTFHDLVDFERLLAERAQDIFSIIQHDETPTVTKRAKSLRIRKLIFGNYSLNTI
jgi:hypothetical protein